MVLTLRLLIGFGLLFALLFGTAGRLDLPWFWLYFVSMGGIGLVVWLVIDSELLRERMKPGRGGIDRHLRLIASAFFAAHLALAGLDVRFGWGPEVPVWLRGAAYAVLLLGSALATWAVAVNRFFSPVVRIQSERGHHVVSDGPYRLIRHPGYASSLLAWPMGGLVLGSWWALIPLAPVVVLLLRRVVIEDRYLHEHLAGYSAYARRVQWRLVPGVW
jgi:protein-S-isoprenylcysteine O-methyltransferase Ste14